MRPELCRMAKERARAARPRARHRPARLQLPDACARVFDALARLPTRPRAPSHTDRPHAPSNPQPVKALHNEDHCCYSRECRDGRIGQHHRGWVQNRAVRVAHTRRFPFRRASRLSPDSNRSQRARRVGLDFPQSDLTSTHCLHSPRGPHPIASAVCSTTSQVGFR